MSTALKTKMRRAYPPTGDGELRARDLAFQTRVAACRLLDARRQSLGRTMDDLA
jgi:hypothetical protein